MRTFVIEQGQIDGELKDTTNDKLHPMSGAKEGKAGKSSQGLANCSVLRQFTCEPVEKHFSPRRLQCNLNHGCETGVGFPLTYYLQDFILTSGMR